MTEAGRITAIVDVDLSSIPGKMNQAKSQIVSSVSGIESDMKGKLVAGLSGALSGGDFGKAGKQIGGSLINSITSSFGPLGGAAGEIATALGPAGIVATAAVAGAAIIASSASSAAMEWEAGMSQISKTTGIEKSSAQFNTLSKDLQNLYSQMPTTVTEIQSVASSAGSLGIAQSEIAGFTNVALQMGSAFDIPAEQAAVSVGKIKSQTKSFSDEVNNLDGTVSDSKFAQHFGSAVDYAGNTLNATESDVLDFSTRTAGAFSNLGGNIYELAGWGGELASVFSSSELGAGSFNAALNQLMGTTKGSENARAKAGELLGVTPEDFQALMTNDPTDTLLDIGKAMEGLSATDKFQAAGILGGGYGDDFFQKMVGKTDEWRGKIEEVKKAGESGTSISGSYAAGADSMEKQLGVLNNSVGAIFQDMGGPINSAITPIISTLSSGLNSIRTIGENLWGPFTAAISPATTAVGLLFDGVSALGGFQLDALVASSGAINTGFQFGSAVVSAFGEELENLITGTDTFQALSDAVEGFEDTLSGIGDKVGEIGGKIADGLKTAIPTAIGGAGNAVGSLLTQAGLGSVADLAGDVNSFFGDVAENAEGKFGLATKEGIKKGAKEAAPDVTSTFEDAAKAAADAFAKENEDYSKSHAGGMSLSNQYDSGKRTSEGKVIYESGELRIIGGQQRDSALTLSAEENFMSFLDKFTVSKVWDKGGETGKITVLDSSGNVVSVGGKTLTSSYLQGGNAVEYRGTYDKAVKELKEQVKSTVIDMPKYLTGVGDEMSSALDGILSDGVVDFTERDQLGDYIASLDQLQLEYPVEFQADKGIQKIRDELKAAKLGAEVDLTGKLETDYTLWQSQHAAEYVKIFESTSKTDKAGRVVQEGINPWKGAERELHESLVKSTDRVNDLYGYIDTAVNSGDVADIQNAYAAMEELGKIKPEILGLAATQYRLQSLQEQYEKVVKVNKEGKLSVLGDSGASINAYVDPQTAAKIMGGGFLTQSMGYASLSKLDDQLFSSNYYTTKPKVKGLSLSGSIDGVGTSDINQGIVSKTSSTELLKVIFGGSARTSALKADLSNSLVDDLVGGVGTSSISLGVSRPFAVMDEAASKIGDFGTAINDSSKGLTDTLTPAITTTKTGFDDLQKSMGTFSATLINFKTDMPPSSNAGSTPTYTYQAPTAGKISADSLLWDLIPKYASGAKVSSPMLAWVGEAGTEYIIPESDIKGLWANSIAAAQKGSMEYYLRDLPMQAYPYSIAGPSGYQWSHWPNAPQVSVSGNVPRAWLSENQESGNEFISSEIRARQLDAIRTGAGSVVPYWMRGEIAQPDWWVKAATKLSPEYASNWAEPKGGSVPQIVSDAKSTSISDDVALIKDPRSDACIAFVKPSGSLRTTDAFYLAQGAANIDTDRALLYDERTDSCIPMLTAPYLKTNDKFYLNSGSQPLGSTATDKRVSSDIADIRDSTKSTADISKGILERSGVAMGSAVSGSTAKSVSVESSASDALVVGKSKEGYVVTYDPRTDTCEGLAFNPPDPSLKTTDKFYLGITSGNLVGESYDEGYGWGGRYAQVLPGAANYDELVSEQKAALAKIDEQTSTAQKTENNISAQGETQQQIATNVQNINDNTAITAAATAGNALTTGVAAGVASAIIGLANRGGGQYWGGTSINGGGYWIGGGSTLAGGVGYVSWGGTAASNSASGGGHGSSGSVQWAQGGLADSPEYFINDGQLSVRGEAGPELILPLNDRRRTAELLRQYLPGARAYAKGGLVGGAMRLDASETLSKISQNIIYSPTINGSGLSKDEIEKLLEKDHKKFLAELNKADKLAKGRRG